MFKRVNSDVVPFSINSPAGNRYAFGTTDVSNDIDANYNENIKKGFGTGPNEFPELEDFNALMFTGSYLAAYLYQAGIPEWNDKQKYYINSIAMGSDGNIYRSLAGTEETPNINNNPTLLGSVSWKSILSDCVKLSGNQTIAGVKTFSSSPIVPTPTTGTQAVNKTYADLKVALTDFTGSNQNKTASGYQKLPGGLIIQWGATTSTTTGESVSNVDITFPIAFPNNLLQITGSVSIFASDLDTNPAYRSTSSTFIFGGLGNYKTGITASMVNLSELSQSRRLRWIAIGY